MKGSNKGIMIMPKNTENLIRAKHWLLSRNKEFKEFRLPVSETESQVMIMAEFDWTDRLLYRLSFRDKTEKVNVYC